MAKAVALAAVLGDKAGVWVYTDKVQAALAPQ
jgi:hypothetical protein